MGDFSFQLNQLNQLIRAHCNQLNQNFNSSRKAASGGIYFAPSGDLGVPETGTNTRETSENHYTTLAWILPVPEGAKNENHHQQFQC